MKNTNEAVGVELTRTEEKDVEQHVAQRTPVIFEIIRRQGEEELGRPIFSLLWSGIAAGLSIGFSVLTQAYLHSYLPQGQGSLLIEKFGYCVGFVLVILAHQQLFTENTITAVIPLIARFDRENLRKFLKLWSTVLFANLVGTFIFAAFVQRSGSFDQSVLAAFHDMSIAPYSFTPWVIGCRGVVAGFLIASLVWILANIDDAKWVLIVLLTYVIALGNLSHIVAGSVEMFFVVLEGTVGPIQAVQQFFLPTLAGNILGGSALFVVIAYGQIHFEMKLPFRRLPKSH